MDTLEVAVHCPQHLVEIIWAEMSFQGYESMMETEKGFLAYLPEKDFDKDLLTDLKEKYSGEDDTISFRFDLIKKTNWNEEWEKNFDPVVVEDQILIRADFHQPRPEIPFEILINPKMSFGTGHHATTYLMLKVMLDTKIEGLDVIDIGCGTGILAIMACKLNAESVFGFDLDGWAVENSVENAKVNGCPGIAFEECELNDIPKTQKYDVVLANINLNYHLQSFTRYKQLLRSTGKLLMSGFFSENIGLMLPEIEKADFQIINEYSRNQWSVLEIGHKI